ncbi:hypothetical protein HMPREF0573_10795 [Mobiluncus curtisii ATCC 43063]|uniref:Uncharacterized protein n=1 Tax=Mobiluncus curtisii (strain ATCC 43063 / DSM 2711 / V125) TaxID=548479 RepID=D6ZK65_MOBCV|nr:hypothetical protein HMPREF0573_10795 [Mobiluncus curtisii ATCC 43063]
MPLRRGVFRDTRLGFHKVGGSGFLTAADFCRVDSFFLAFYLVLLSGRVMSACVAADF